MRNDETNSIEHGLTRMNINETKKPAKRNKEKELDYGIVIGDVAGIVEAARRSALRKVNAAMTAAYWLIGQRIMEFDQEGSTRADYGSKLLKHLAKDLSAKFGRGFSERNLEQMRLFYLNWPISQTLSAKLPDESGDPEVHGICWTPSGKSQMLSAESFLEMVSKRFQLPWSAYVRLLSVKNENARQFYQTEALRGGWSVRQLDRQINSQFYERTALSKNKVVMLQKGEKTLPEDIVTPEEEIKDPYVLEFLGLKDEYSETDLENALIRHLQTFLLELGGDFCFVGRQKRLRIGDEWYRVDLVFFHRKLRSLVIIDLKIGKFTHADAGQMHLYLNYAREHWILEGENPPVGLILCARKDEAVARYALEGLPNKVTAAEYRTTLPDEKTLAAEIRRTQEILQTRNKIAPTSPGETGMKRIVKKKQRTKKGDSEW